MEESAFFLQTLASFPMEGIQTPLLSNLCSIKYLKAILQIQIQIQIQSWFNQASQKAKRGRRVGERNQAISDDWMGLVNNQFVSN